ncbi:hypothetical protein B0T09DRAFT_261172 [Sordaria sp. MPI-SDFR-AT-0083]|nr:hypothetical protein B0T09DRAFT_261172 [Sordaria sp. MPI-SDFR-AT-0083]
MDQQLSPVWKHLPLEIVQEILGHYVEDILYTCRTYPDWSVIAEIREQGPPFDDIYQFQRENLEEPACQSLLTAATIFRQDCDLFKPYKPRIERYFHDEWISSLLFLVCVDFDRGYYYRYSSVPPRTYKHTRSVADTSGGKATFLLHTSTVSLGQHTVGDDLDLPEHACRVPLVRQWCCLEYLNGDWAPSHAEQDNIQALLGVWENYENMNDELGLSLGDHPVFMVGTVPAFTCIDSKVQLPPLSGPDFSRRKVLDSSASPVKLEGLEVYDSGHRIRFKWHDLIPTIIYTTYGVVDDENQKKKGEDICVS